MISETEIRAHVMRLMRADFVPSTKNIAALIGHLDATDYRMVLEAGMTSAINAMHTYRDIAQLTKEIMHQAEEVPAGCLPDLYQMALDAAGGNLTLAIAGVKTGAIAIHAMPVADNQKPH